MSPDNSPNRRALIVDDHPIITDALGAALVSLRIVDHIDNETSIHSALQRLGESDLYDLVMLDLHLSDAEGLNGLLQLRERFPDVPVIIFSGDESSATVAAAFEHGAHGYIPKSSTMPVVVNAIRVVLAGGNYIPAQAARMLGFEARTQPAKSMAETATLPSLSARQRQVMHCLLQGLPNKVIATRLQMADGTVKSHLNSIYRQFAVNSRAQLILKARDVGLN